MTRTIRRFLSFSSNESVASLISRNIDSDEDSNASTADDTVGDDSVDNNNDTMPALIHSFEVAFMASTEESDYDSWEENSDNSDVPFRDIVRDPRYDTTSSDDDNDNEERVVKYSMEDLVNMSPDRLIFEQDEESTFSSLDPYPDAYKLRDQDLQERIRRIKDVEWSDEHRNNYVLRLRRYIIGESIESNEVTTTFFNESKIEDYDNPSWRNVHMIFFDKRVSTRIDYRIDSMLPERIAAEQRRILYGFSLVAYIEDNDMALNAKTVENDLMGDIWVGNTGALCHMRTSIHGMYDLRPGSGGI